MAKKLKHIVVLNDFCHVQGGASKIAIDEAVGLCEKGYDVTFIGATGPVGEELLNSNVSVECLGQPELISVGKNPSVMLQGLWNYKAYKETLEVLNALDPASTVIHLHGYTKSLSTSPITAANKKGFTAICTLHDFFAACPNGAQFDYVVNAPCPRKCLSMSCVTANCDKRGYHHKLYRVARSFAQKILGAFPRSVKCYIQLSNTSANILKNYLPKNAKFFPLENLIEVNKSAAVDVTANDHLVYVGRLDREKGIEHMLEAISAANIPLTIVGDGPLRELAEKSPHVTVTGWVTPARVQEELSKARALVFPSLWYEAYGLVVSEAFAQGLPAIISDVSAPSERITDGIEGWIYPAGDIAALTAKLEATKDNETLAKAGKAAYEKFWKNTPTRDNHINGLVQIYEEILGE